MHDLTVPWKLLVIQIADCGVDGVLLLDHARCGISSFELDGAAPTTTLQQKSTMKLKIQARSRFLGSGSGSRQVTGKVRSRSGLD